MKYVRLALRHPYFIYCLGDIAILLALATLLFSTIQGAFQ